MKKNYVLFLLLFFVSFSPCISQNQSEKQIDSLLNALTSQKADTNRVNTAIKLGFKLLPLNEDLGECLAIAKESLLLAEELEFDRGIARLNYLIGICYSKLEKFDIAIEHYKVSEVYCEKVKDFKTIANIHNNIGICYEALGNYPESIKRYLQNIKYFEEQKDPFSASFGYSNMAMAYSRMGELDKALDFSLKSYNVCKELGGDLDVYFTAMFVGEVFEKLGETKKAVTYFQESYEISNRLEDKSYVGFISEKMGRLYSDKDKDAAYKYLNQSLAIVQELELLSSEVSTLNAIGRLNLIGNDLVTADSILSMAYDKIDENTEKKNTIENYKLRSSLYSKKEDFEKAFKWFKSKDSLETETFKKDEVNKIQAKYDLALREKEFNAEKLAQDQRIQSQKRIILYLVIGGIIFAVFSFITYKTQRTKIAYAKVIDKQATELKKSNNVKDRLFSIISHDLKNSIFTTAEVFNLMKDKTIGTDDFKELLPDLASNATNTSLMLTNLLNWSQSQMNSLKAAPVVFNIKDISKRKKDFYESYASDKGISIIDNVGDSSVYADMDMIDIVMQNLIGNAVKFCEKGDKITLSIEENMDTVTICVKDTGRGIPKEKIDDLFTESSFTTIGTEKEKGTGLGLIICKELVALNNGSIRVESVENEGSKFCVILPKSPS